MSQTQGPKKTQGAGHKRITVVGKLSCIWVKNFKKERERKRKREELGESESLRGLERKELREDREKEGRKRREKRGLER